MILDINLGNLGDCLIATPLLRSSLFTAVNMPDDKTTRSSALVFKNIVPVEFVPSVVHCVETREPLHRARCYLRARGLDHLSPLPFMVLDPKEIYDAALLLAAHSAKPLLAVNFTTMNKGGDEASFRRSIPDDMARYIVRAATDQGYQCINIGVSNNHTPRIGVIDILDLDVRQTAACYHLIGRYIGGESGPVHLMMANGGKVAVLHPDIDPLYYPGWMAHYTPDMFGNAPVRAQYLNKREYFKVPLALEWLR